MKYCLHFHIHGTAKAKGKCKHIRYVSVDVTSLKVTFQRSMGSVYVEFELEFSLWPLTNFNAFNRSVRKDYVQNPVWL